ncbi:MAG: hypothetical protein M3Y13_07105 [Armatimonadota bacterium]|nr:hypothetical protein [Armatimonadota bacterium]
MPLSILDTNILLAYVRQSALSFWIEARYALTTTNPTPLLSVVSEGELRSLARQLAWGLDKTRRMQTLLNLFPIVPLPYDGIVDAYAEIDDYSRRQGISMGKNEFGLRRRRIPPGRDC